ncbi:hypothetical protein FA95DRAFT_1553324 [Auriscalpium vulgare]|uniref:Uncharacterized protein n=1 Tax=Auriscalpium vulgare TaxID=40419 RepID=A0ACB8S9S8_9AGAM|nr:hypothetical protein FA95DRAFT_1553324 [Auriscalpium vulgare]
MATDSSKSKGKSFTQIYDSLPPDAQRDLLERYLAPVLDDLPEGTTNKVFTAARNMQKRYAGMPVLDLQAKQAELHGLLLELDRDAKRYLVKERSIREDLLDELIDSLSGWMSDIWSVVYEYQTNFKLAHQCLLLAADTIAKVALPAGGCKCATMNLYISTVIRRRKTRKVVKSFQLTGVLSFEKVLLWIWRDLFVSLLANAPEQKELVHNMLQTIQETMGWPALERMLFGGKMGHRLDGAESGDDDEDDFGDETDDEDDAHDEDNDRDDEDDDVWSDEDEAGDTWREHLLACPFHSDHWTRSVDAKSIILRGLVHEHLVSHFSVAPSLELYSAIQAISTVPASSHATLLRLVQENALCTADSFVAALDIYAHENQSNPIRALLERGSHLLRPRDAVIYQNATMVMSQNRLYKQPALSIVEKELVDTARSIGAALRSSFSRIYDPGPSTELEKILKLSQNSLSRQNRIEAWVNSITTPGSHPANPMALAAMMMGLPIPGMTEDINEPDPVGFLELDKEDPDLDDLRDEMKPKMKDRFDGWVEMAVAINATGTLIKVFKDVVTMMPFLKASDVVEEMLNRLSDKPTNHHVCDALETLHSFSKVQKKKALALVEKQKRREAAKVAGNNGTSSIAGPTPSSSTSTSASASFSSAMPPTFGGIEDVD